MHDRPVARLRYRVGNALRFLSRPWRQRTICPEDATTIFGCSFGDGGWHHIRRMLFEFDADPSIAPAESSLGRYLERFCPSSISILAGVTGEEPLPLFVYPWGTFNDGVSQSAKDAFTSRFCGPSTAAFVDEEFRRTVGLYADMRLHGYRPTCFPNSYIGGTWLEAVDGRQRFVVMQGNHRMAILAHLGAPQIEVRTIPQALTCVKEADIAQWPLVADGRCSIDHARRVFNMFFSESGWHVANLVGSNA
jgi:hypothetical protein